MGYDLNEIYTKWDYCALFSSFSIAYWRNFIMELYKRGKTWTFRIRYKDTTGKRKSLSKGGFRTKTEAYTVGLELELKYKQVGLSTDENISFYDYYQNWIKVYKIGKLDKTTESRYNAIGKFIKENFHDDLLKQITKAQYQKALDDYAAKHVKHTVRRFNGIIRHCIKDALEDRVIYRDFTRDVVIQGSESKASDLKYLEKNEASALKDYCLKNASLKSISYYEIIFGLMTGCRYGEVTGLTWKDINYKDKTISITKAYDYKFQTGFKNVKTPSSVRVITINDELITMLKKLHKEQNTAFMKQGYRDDLNLVFRNNCHQIISDEAVNKTLRTILDSDHINSKNTITFHGLRHTHASLLISNDIGIDYISKRLGHSNTSVTMNVYLHLLESKRKVEDDNAMKFLETI